MSTFILPYKRHDKMEEVQKCYDRVFSSPDGRIVLNHLLGDFCDLARANIPQNEKDVFKNIGRQKVGLDILTILNPTKE